MNDNLTKEEKELVEATSEHDVLRAFLKLLPNPDENFRSATSDKPLLFIQKLMDVGIGIRARSAAAGYYAAAQVMRMKWEKCRLEKEFIVRMDEHLTSIYDEENDFLPEDIGNIELEKARGTKLYHECLKRAENVHLDGFTIDHAVSKGELHCIANDEGFNGRKITWLRQ